MNKMNQTQLPLNKTPGAAYWNKFLELPKDEIATLLKSNEAVRNQAQKLFKQFVCIVNVETATRCNRKCSYCPDSIFDRSKQKHMNQEIWSKLLDELSQIEFTSTISLNLYNEPLADPTLIEKIKQVRARLPDSFIKFNSNRDYLNELKLEELSDAGTSAIFVTLHCSPGTQYIDADRLLQYDKFFKRIGHSSSINVTPGVSMRSDFYYNKMRVLTMADNWMAYGNDRSGLVAELSIHKRSSPCVRPFREFTIGWDGYVYPCCQFFPDSPTSTAHRVGHLGDSSIFNLYASKVLASYRRDLLGFNVKKSPCDTCRDPDNASSCSAEIREKILSFQ